MKWTNEKIIQFLWQFWDKICTTFGSQLSSVRVSVQPPLLKPLLWAWAPLLS
jgi:hypothetical protein